VTDRRDRPADPRAAFVVKTVQKADGRRIHYYEWPDQPTEPQTDAAGKASPPEKRRV
jgi:hypothetical protein